MSGTTDQIAAMRERMHRYRRLSTSVLDRETASVLVSMADQLQCQISQLEAQLRDVNPAYVKEAEDCRRKARNYPAGPEAQFLLRVAQAFDELARRN